MSNRQEVSYADLWRIFKENEHYRPQILHWVDLRKNLPNLSYKLQIEVLENAPMDVIKAHSNLLHDQTKKSLGLEVEKKKNHNKSFGKEFSFFR